MSLKDRERDVFQAIAKGDERFALVEGKVNGKREALMCHVHTDGEAAMLSPFAIILDGEDVESLEIMGEPSMSVEEAEAVAQRINTQPEE